ncbi:MAG: HNH endonuclease [Deltaproteobacteria bacterium]|nr:HNH endonuclease [Deltaproteobacteria bacterium]
MLNIELHSNTVELLKIDYVPDHWPTPGTYQYLGSHIQKPWEGGTAYSGYTEQLQRFNNIKEILKPHKDDWVDCHCIAALVPYDEEERFDVIINGLHMCDVVLNLKSLRKLNGIKTPITTCNAKIDGGGYLSDGRHRSYNIMLDLPRSKKDILSLQRSKEKSQFNNKFALKVIQDFYKNKFFELFNHQCFKCGSIKRLDIDHHIPIVLGGHLVPGNLVALCKTCNNKKHDCHPNDFYTQSELKTLEPLLEKQKDILKFNFDQDYWHCDRKGYLISLGVEPSLVHEILNNPNHPYYIEPAALQNPDMVITIDVSDLLDAIAQDNPVNNKERKQ